MVKGQTPDYSRSLAVAADRNDYLVALRTCSGSDLDS